MKEIKQTAIVGMGALGLLYGDRIAENLGIDSICFVADEERIKRYQETVFTINGTKKHFIAKSADAATTVDLVIVATKYNHLSEALDEMKNLVGDATTIISIINGISSEEIIAERFGAEKVLYTVAQGMDAVKVGGKFEYTNFGELRIGTNRSDQDERLKAVIDFFKRAQIPYTTDRDIVHRMWGKFMLNVGINQVCMVYETTYGGALTGKEEWQMMQGAMQEVMTIARAEGIKLSQKDFDEYVALMKTLDPNAMPSMRQDGIKHRPSEVEMFAGKVIELAKKHNIPVPINVILYNKVKAMEARY